jgi:hypothetical protein
LRRVEARDRPPGVRAAFDAVIGANSIAALSD